MTAQTVKGQRTQTFRDGPSGLLYLGTFDHDSGEVIPDEALTKAAPQLLEALEAVGEARETEEGEILCWCAIFQIGRHGETCRRVRALIAQVRGQ